MGAINAIKDAINFLTAPAIFISLAAILFFITLSRRGFWTKRVAIVGGVLGTIFVAVSMLDKNFALGATYFMANSDYTNANLKDSDINTLQLDAEAKF